MQVGCWSVVGGYLGRWLVLGGQWSVASGFIIRLYLPDFNLVIFFLNKFRISDGSSDTGYSLFVGRYFYTGSHSNSTDAGVTM